MIGGFFELELSPAIPSSVAAAWGLPSPCQTFANARSALARLLAVLRSSRLWLPAFICPAVVQAAEAARTLVSFYPVDAELEPDAPFLDANAAPGEAVLAVDYFGRCPGSDFLTFVRRRRDLCFIEDAVQAFDTGQPRWGDWQLRSPRKLLGVPDGGFFVPSLPAVEPSLVSASRSAIAVRAALLRSEDLDQAIQPCWHDANQRREAAETVSDARMSRLSTGLLNSLPARPIVERRTANFSILATRLAAHRFAPSDQPLLYTPFGFPVRLASRHRNAVQQYLASKQIFAAVHWPNLPSPGHFTEAHGLAAELLTLPCDQRYTETDMHRVADALLAAAAA